MGCFIKDTLNQAKASPEGKTIVICIMNTSGGRRRIVWSSSPTPEGIICLIGERTCGRLWHYPKNGARRVGRSFWSARPVFPSRSLPILCAMTAIPSPRSGPENPNPIPVSGKSVRPNIGSALPIGWRTMAPLTYAMVQLSKCSNGAKRMGFSFIRPKLNGGFQHS